MPEARDGDVRLRAAHHHDQDQPREDPRDHRQGRLDDPQDPGRDPTEINVEDDGTVEIAAVSGENSRKAIDWIESLTREVEVGALYMGKVTRIMGFGAFVEILPGKEGLVRIGELADYHVPTVEDVVSVGDEVMVVVTEIDRQGRINLSRKAAMQRHLAKGTGLTVGAKICSRSTEARPPGDRRLVVSGVDSPAPRVRDN